ncbi:MAG: nitroreductase family protein [Akkermansia sp.]
MNATLETLKSRRSCRHYRPEPITEAELDAVLEVGTYAPTGHGSQSPVMVAVRSPELLKRLSAVNAAIMGTDRDPFYGAPTAIIVFADTSAPTGHQDACMVMANLMHAAHALGLGSCWINRAKQMFALPELADLRAKWGLKPEMEGMGICILGYIPEGTVLPCKARKEGYIIKD